MLKLCFTKKGKQRSVWILLRVKPVKKKLKTYGTIDKSLACSLVLVSGA